MGKVVTNEGSGRARVRGCALASASILSLVVMSVAAKAQPTGGSVVAGQAQISSSGATTLINQSTSKAIINWQSFSVGQGSSVQFNQPNSSAITLNRVTGTSASVIDGAIRANGQVWLLNPNGLLFGNGATINVAGLLATTSDINDQDFLSGRYNFSSTGGKGAITNSGTITAGNGGSVVLSAPSVTNKGLIQATAGHVVLGGTDTFTVDFQGDHLLNYAISPNSTGGKVSNSGKIAAAGGSILMTARAAAGVQDAVINNTGMVEATSVRQENGEIILEADNGTVADSGTLDASGKGAGETGGTVKVLGQQVAVADGARIDVSGDAGGGTALIGGNLHGAGPEPNAQNTSVGKATINASAISRGNGGTVAVYSTGTTQVAATITAKGGIISGKGGMVETSGHILGVSPDASVSTAAPHGTSGTWLLDPDFINITSVGSEGVSQTFSTTGTTASISSSTIAAALASGSVDLQANFDITVNSPVTTASSNTLYLEAGRSIFLNQGLQNTGGGEIALFAGDTSAPGGVQSGATIFGSGVVSASLIQLSLGTTGSIGTAAQPVMISYAQPGTLLLGVESLGANAYVATANGIAATAVSTYNSYTTTAPGLVNHQGVNLTSDPGGTIAASTTVGSFSLTTSVPLIENWGIRVTNVTVAATGNATISLNDIGVPVVADVGNQVTGSVNLSTANGDASYGNTLSGGTTLTGTTSIAGNYTITSGLTSNPSVPTTTYYPLTIASPINASGTVSITATDIQQSGTGKIAASGAVLIANAGSVGSSTTPISLSNGSSPITVSATSTTTGTFLSATGAMQVGGQVDAHYAIDAGTGDVSLTATGNIYQTAGTSFGIAANNLTVASTGGSVTLADAGSCCTDNGNVIAGTVRFNTASNVSFTNADNQTLTTTIGASTVGGNLTVLATTTGLALADSSGNITVSGAASLTSGIGAISQTIPLLTGTGLTASAPGGITLTNAANAINGAVNLSVITDASGSASFTNTTNTTIGAIDIQNGGLTISTSGAIALTGIVSVNGSAGQTTSFNAGGSIGQPSGAITVSGATGAAFKAFASGTNTSLSSTNNNISVPVSLYGQNIAFANSTAITLSSVSLDGTLPASSVAILSSGGSISQTATSAILTANLSATTQAAALGTITLGNVGNAIGIARFATTSGDVSYSSSNSTTLGNSNVGGNLTVNVSTGQLFIADPGNPNGMVQASGAISLTASSDVVQGTSYTTGNPLSLVKTNRIPVQPGSGYSLNVQSGADIQLDATNVVAGRLTLNSTNFSPNISFTNQSGITVVVGAGAASGIATTGSINTGSGPATVALTSVDGSIDVQGSITVNGTTTLNAPNGTISLEGQLTASYLSNLGTLVLNAGLGISQAASGTITSGYLKAITQNGGITLTAANNQIYSFIDMQAPGNISLVNSANIYIDTIGNGLVSIGGVNYAPAAATSVTLSAPNIYPNTTGGYGIAAGSIFLTTAGGFVGCANIDLCSMIIQPLMISGGFAGTNPDSAAVSLSVSTNGGSAYLLSRSPVTITGSGINLNSGSGYSGSLLLSSYGGVNVYGPVSTSGNVIDIDSGGAIQLNMPISAAMNGSGPGAIVLTANDHNLNSIDAGVSFNSSSNGITGFSTLTAGIINLTADFGLTNGQGGSIGTQGQPLQVSSDTGSLSLALHTFDGNAYISSAVGVSIDHQSSVLLGQFAFGGPPLNFGATGINTLGNNGLYGQLSLTAAGPITQTYGIQSGNLTLTATGPTGSINLTDSAVSPDPGNQVFGTVHLNSSSDATFATNLIVTNLGASSVAGNLTVTAASGDLNIADPNGGAVNVTGATTFTAGSGYGISIQSPLISGSNIVLLAGRDISQGVTTGSTDVHIQTGGTLLASTGTGSISLMDLGHGCSSGSGCTADVGNQVAGSVQLDAAGNVAFANVPGVTITTSAALGQFLVETPGNITIAPGASIKAGGSVGSTSSVGSVGSSSTSSGGSVGSPSSAPTSTAAIVLAAGGSFINNSGLGQSTLLLANGGGFDIYSQAPTGDTFGGLNSNNQAIWDATYAVPVTVSGSRYIFAYQPTLTVAVNGNAGKVYGVDDTSTVAQIGYSITGLQPGLAGVYFADTAANIYGAATTVSTGAAAKANVGTYAITVSNLGVADGYALSVQGGTLTVTPATLTYLANAENRYAGQPNSAFSGVVTGFVNGDTLSSAATGTLVFSSTATATSPAGSYAINGSGLSAANYVFVQAAGNATALTVVAPPITGATPVLTGFTAAIQPPVLNSIASPLAVFQFNPITLPVVPPLPLPPLPSPPPVASPLADNNSEQPTSSDQTTSQVADSLDGNNNPPTDNGNGAHDNGGVVIPRMLVNSHTSSPPPTDISALSSFGNSSLWQ